MAIEFVIKKSACMLVDGMQTYIVNQQCQMRVYDCMFMLFIAAKTDEKYIRTRLQVEDEFEVEPKFQRVEGILSVNWNELYNAKNV